MDIKVDLAKDITVKKVDAIDDVEGEISNE